MHKPSIRNKVHASHQTPKVKRTKVPQMGWFYRICKEHPVTPNMSWIKHWTPFVIRKPEPYWAFCWSKSAPRTIPSSTCTYSNIV